jgi:hypothetical protein
MGPPSPRNDTRGGIEAAYVQGGLGLGVRGTQSRAAWFTGLSLGRQGPDEPDRERYWGGWMESVSPPGTKGEVS